MMILAAIACCMVVNAANVANTLQRYEDDVLTISNRIERTEKSLVTLVAATNMSAEAKAPLVTAAQNQIQELKEQLEAAKKTTAAAQAELKSIQGFSTENVVDVPKMDLSTISQEDANSIAVSRYTSNKKLYHSKWFSSKDDVLNHTILRGISVEKDTKKKAAMLFQYLSEQL